MSQSLFLKKEYEIHPKTMAIIPHEYGRKNFSKVIEVDESYVVPKKPLEIIKESCYQFGSSYEGRRDGAKRLLSLSHKLPVAIDPYHFIYFFPTHSPSREYCSWISHQHVIQHISTQHKDTEVLFKNRQTVIFPVSNETFTRQLQQTSHLITLFLQRMGHMSQRVFFIHPRMKDNDPYGSIDTLLYEDRRPHRSRRISEEERDYPQDDVDN